jgi:hypothetical protein
MKKLQLILSIIFPSILFAQQIATTSDGKKVLLKNDKTWEYNETETIKTKITFEFTCKDAKKQFQVVYDASDSRMVESGSMVGGFYNCGWKKSMYVDRMENQMTLKVATMGTGSEMVTLNMYVNDKLVKTITEKAKNLIQGPATLVVNLEDYKEN